MSNKPEYTEEYTEERYDHDSENVMRNINGKSSNVAEAVHAKKEKERQEKIGRFALRFIAAGLTLWAMYHAKTAGLISPVITTPASCVGFTYLGWCLCKLAELSKRK